MAGTILDAWRFPIVDSYGGGAEAVAERQSFPFYNQVTFIFHATGPTPPQSVGVIGTFHNMYEPVLLAPVPFGGGETPFWAISVAIPKREVHRYRYVVDDVVQNDPINPQMTTLPTGRKWSRFFTDRLGEEPSTRGLGAGYSRSARRANGSFSYRGRRAVSQSVL